MERLTVETAAEYHARWMRAYERVSWSDFQLASEARMWAKGIGSDDELLAAAADSEAAQAELKRVSEQTGPATSEDQ